MLSPKKIFFKSFASAYGFIVYTYTNNNFSFNIKSGRKMGSIENSGLDVETGKRFNCDNNIASVEEVKYCIEYCSKNMPNFHKRMLYFTLGYIRSYFEADTIDELGADDVLQIMIEKMLQGKRKWDKSKIADFPNFLRLIIISFIRNEKKRADRLNKVPLWDDEDELIEESYPDYVKACIQNDLVNGLLQGDYDSLSKQLLLEFKDDTIAYFVLECKLEGGQSNLAIAGKLGLTVDDVINASKRIKYKFKTKLEKKFLCAEHLLC